MTHVHVYRVIGLQEIDAPTDDATEAKALALKLAKGRHDNDAHSPWHEPDCKMIAVAPEQAKCNCGESLFAHPEPCPIHGSPFVRRPLPQEAKQHGAQ